MVEMLAECGVVLADSGHAMADSPGDRASGALGRRRSTSIAPAESDRTGQLPDQAFAFGIGLRCPVNIRHRPRFLNVVVDLCEPSAIRLFGARIEQLTGVSRVRYQAGSSGIAGRVERSFAGSHEVTHVELAPRIGEETRQVLQALRIAQACGVLLEPDRPVVTFAMAHGGIAETRISRWMQ